MGMRIVGGVARGGRLLPFKGVGIRPTSDKVRESVFNILAGRFPVAGVLDLFAGTGAMGIEAISRGAERALFVESDKTAARLVEKNLEKCGFLDRGHVLKMKALEFLASADSLHIGFDMIFADPPYGYPHIRALLELLEKGDLLLPGGIVVLESSKKAAPDMRLSRFELIKERIYGNTMIRFFGK